MSGEWMASAACAGTDPELFHAQGVGYRYELAKRICAGCPVTVECLRYAMRLETNHRWRFGVWGGTTPGQREALAERARY